MSRLINAQLKSSGKRYTFKMDEGDVRLGDTVIVDTEFGAETATVLSTVSSSTLEIDREFRRVLRVATDDDLKRIEENSRLEEEGRAYCLERIRERNLPMRLVATEITFDKKKFSFYFTAEKRVDFRELVKDLASKFRTRIELRQIGIRDEARMLGGLGGCGREVCCKLFLTEFAPISIKMAKKQELALNPTKISGRCGRLMCCLSYEYAGSGAKAKEAGPAPEKESEIREQKKTPVAPSDSVPVEITDKPGMEPAAEPADETEVSPVSREKPPEERKRGRGKGRRRSRGRKSRPGKQATGEGKAETATAASQARPASKEDADDGKAAAHSESAEGQKKPGRRRRRRKRGNKKIVEENKT